METFSRQFCGSLKSFERDLFIGEEDVKIKDKIVKFWDSFHFINKDSPVVVSIPC